ncbi:MAG: nucleotidyltransferase family protein [Bacteroidota bacterium]
MFEAIVLAAGLSSRMGAENKLLLPFRGKAILQHTLDALLNAQIDRVIVVTGYEQEKIQSLLRDHSVTLIHNENYRKGQLTSIQKGLSQLSSICNAFLICLSDMPLLNAADCNALIEGCQTTNISEPIVVPHNGERAGNPKLFDIHYKKEILSLDASKHQGAKGILEKYSNKVLYHNTNNLGLFFDVDTPRAYLELLEYQ